MDTQKWNLYWKEVYFEGCPITPWYVLTQLRDVLFCESHCSTESIVLFSNSPFFVKAFLERSSIFTTFEWKFLLHFLKWIFDFNHWSKSTLRIMQWWHPHYGRPNYLHRDPFSKVFQFLSHKNSFFFFSYSFCAIVHTIEVNQLILFKIANVQPIPLFL